MAWPVDRNEKETWMDSNTAGNGDDYSGVPSAAAAGESLRRKCRGPCRSKPHKSPRAD